MSTLPGVKLRRLVLGPVQTNTYIIGNTETNEAIVVDPADRADLIIEELKKEELTLAAIILTHGHFDHMQAADQLRKEYGVKVYAHEKEAELLKNPELNLSKAFTGRENGIEAEEGFVDGQEIELAGFRVKVIHTPGHTAGGCCYYFEEYHLLFSGDTLFYTTVGRTDFPTGNYATLKRSIREKLFTLPEETKVLPGHEGTTTIGYEKVNNREA